MALVSAATFSARESSFVLSFADWKSKLLAVLAWADVTAAVMGFWFVRLPGWKRTLFDWSSLWRSNAAAVRTKMSAADSASA